MSNATDLADFVKSALTAGRSRAEISDALETAGWAKPEIAAALAAYADVDFTPPVPRPRAYVTAKDAFFYAVLFAALAFTAGHLVSLIHDMIDLFWPNPAEQLPFVADSGVRWSVAVLLISGPTYLWLAWRDRRAIAGNAGVIDSPARKWLTYVALFIAVGVFFSDGVYTIYAFLNGEATLRFILKALTVAVISGGVIVYYQADARRADGAG